jgi:site-specific recombinase XerD
LHTIVNGGILRYILNIRFAGLLQSIEREGMDKKHFTPASNKKGNIEMKYINEYLEKMLETKSEQTVKGHKSTLNTFSKFVDAEEPVQVLVKDVVRFRQTMYQEKKAGTVNTMLKRVKLFFEWCAEYDYVDVSPAKEVKLLTEAEPLPKWLDEKQEDLLVRSIRSKYLGEDSKKSYRELAIVMLMLKAGLRIGEVTGLKWENVQIHEGKGKMLIRGKGNQQRTVPLIPDLVAMIEQYKAHHGLKGEYVFYSQKADSITERMIQNIIKDFEGVSIKGTSLNELHPHMLRHTFAHNLAKAGMQLEAIARVLGHMKQDGTPNIAMTIRYTKANEQEIGDDMERILSIS